MGAYAARTTVLTLAQVSSRLQHWGLEPRAGPFMAPGLSSSASERNGGCIEESRED